jgi:hypothetical protein
MSTIPATSGRAVQPTSKRSLETAATVDTDPSFDLSPASPKKQKQQTIASSKPLGSKPPQRNRKIAGMMATLCPELATRIEEEFGGMDDNAVTARYFQVKDAHASALNEHARLTGQLKEINALRNALKEKKNALKYANKWKSVDGAASTCLAAPTEAVSKTTVGAAPSSEPAPSEPAPVAITAGESSSIAAEGGIESVESQTCKWVRIACRYFFTPALFRHCDNPPSSSSSFRYSNEFVSKLFSKESVTVSTRILQPSPPLKSPPSSFSPSSPILTEKVSRARVHVVASEPAG